MTDAKLEKKAPPPAAKWISFLRQYGPLPQNGNQYDEDIQKISRKNKLAPLKLPTPALEQILAALRANPPRSIIVTGTAGDGKTYHCREAWMQLGGTPEAWEALEKVKTLDLGGGRELVVVRDFSEIHRPEHPEERDQLLQQMAVDLLNPQAQRLYLVAANDGQLLEQWKAVPRTPEVEVVHAAIEDRLVEGHTAHNEVLVDLVNLGQQPARSVLPLVLDAVLEHPSWGLCSECPLREPPSQPSCPIWENRRRLRDDARAPLLRERLSKLMELCDRNGTHFPIRQLFLLASNTVLGHPRGEHGLLRCEDVESIQSEGAADQASLYRNVFGKNLKPRRQRTTPIFESLARFGIGSETSNRIDAVLVYGADDPELAPIFIEHMRDDALYGAGARFLNLQTEYLEGGEDAEKNGFLTALTGQRQRLFFTLPASAVVNLGLWELTVFRYAGEYLEAAERLLDGHAVARPLVHKLVRGLNRVFTGILLDNHDELLLASSGSNSSAKISTILEERISVAAKLGEEVTVKADSGRVFLSTAIGSVPGVVPLRLELTLLRFEFLRRVGDGALPSSFSLECYEDFLAYKATLLKALEVRRSHEATAVVPDELQIRFMKIGDDGRATPEYVEVKL